MLFNSHNFIFVFLPFTYGGYLVAQRVGGRSASVGWLAVASIAFYALGEAADLVVISGSIAFNYLVGAALAHSSDPARRRWLLLIGLTGNLGALGYFKYTNFVVGTLSTALHTDLGVSHVALPVGISFFTFTQIAYLVDAYRGEARDYSPVSYALFVTFFPHLIAGPIIHHREMMPQFGRQQRADHASDAAVGLSIFIVGLAKKVLIADAVAPLSSRVFDATAAGLAPTFIDACVGTLAYSFQIYFDFSGYSDMAIGLSRMFGIRLPINFDSPYRATSIVDFWRRWHITLSRFLRDYLYVPLGGNRKGSPRRYFNLVCTMLLGGVWHGAGWTFVLWGGLHGLFLAFNHLWQYLRMRLRVPAMPSSVARLVTFTCVAIAWIPFRAANFDVTVAMWRGLVGANGAILPARLPWPISGFGSGGEIVSALGPALLWLPALLCAVWTLPNTQELFSRWEPGLVSPGYRRIGSPPRWAGWASWRPSAPHALALAAVAFIVVLHLADISEFIYFQF